MVPFVLLLVSLLAFRSLGAAGVEPLSDWRNAAACSLALMFLFTASAHFTSTKKDLIAMVPSVFPRPELMVIVTGILEILGAIGLLIPATRSFAGIGLILLLVALFPANVAAARKQVPLRGKPPTPLPFRLFLQLAFIGTTWWATQT
ncbi:MAG TPA: DoxX family protein [Rubrobacter sp.]|nr:DoxX family protein [Rubrobacter sp.]